MRDAAFAATVLLGAWTVLFLLHPPPGFLWAEYPWVVYHMLPLPFSLEGMSEAIRWQATVHTPGQVRPVRAMQWWLAAKALGCDPLAYFVANVFALGAAVWAVFAVARRVTASHTLALTVALCFLLSFATTYSLLFFGFGVTAACAFGGLAACFRAAGAAGGARRGWQAGGFVLLLAAGLAHETFLALTLVPLAHAAIVRRERRAVLGALGFTLVLPLYALVGRVMAGAFGGAAPAVPPILAGWRAMPETAVEFPARVLFAVLSGGLPADPLRALPWFPEFGRLREVLATPAGLLTVAAVVGPAVVLTTLAWRTTAADVAARRRVWFCLAWLATGSLPLMLPVGTPEAFHLTGALPALFLLWTEALRPGPARRAALAVAVAFLVFWLGVHVAARTVLFHRDLPRMAAAVHALERELARAETDGAWIEVLFFPIQVGAHYGFIPTVPPLYPAGAPGRGPCARGELTRGCLVEPAWVWSGLGPAPPLPAACRTGDAIRVGPITAAVERQLDGSRHMLAHRAAGWATHPTQERVVGARLVDACPLPRIERVREGETRYWLYRMTAAPPGTRWYRFSLEPSPRLVPITDCEDARRAGKS